MMLFDQTFKNVRRVREIASILWKYGFEEFVSKTALGALIPNRQRLGWKVEREKHKRYSRWELLRMAAEELGPTFIKLAQVLSNRPDVLPKDLIIELQKLQSNVPPFPFEEVQQIVEKSLKKPLHEVFSDFKQKPIGSASIGQVHVAKLLDGRRVVVKVQRPKVKEKVITDLVIVRELVKRGESLLEAQGVFNGIDIIDAFEKSMKKELDYSNEAKFMQQFKTYYKDFKKFYTPEVYHHLSSDAILVMEFIDGCKITDVKKLRSWGLSPETIAEAGIGIYLTQIFEHGYFHADPHPGNILIKKDGTICLIDFGMVGKLSKRDKHAFGGILIGMAQQNPAKMARAFKRLAVGAEIKNEAIFENELADIVSDYASQNLDDVNVTEIAERMQNMIREHKIRLPGSIFLIMRALTILEGIGKTIHPQFNTYNFFKPYGIKLLKEQYSAANITEEVMNVVGSFYSFATSFPIELKAILQQARHGKLRLEVGIEGQREAATKLARAVNRLSLSFIITALFLSSALLAVANAVRPNDILIKISILSMSVATAFCLLLGWAFWKSTR